MKRTATSVSVPNVFVNCPFDAQYELLFRALIFCLYYCGCRARCALEVDDSAQVRIDKICHIIGECVLGIHDISRTEADAATGLPRFNMPLELGVFLGAKRYGPRTQRGKACLILDSERFRYQQFLSDISGQDIRAHHNDPRAVIRVVRNWLQSQSGRRLLPGGAAIWTDYILFQEEFPMLLAALRLDPDELTFLDYTTVVAAWLRDRMTHDELQG